MSINTDLHAIWRNLRRIMSNDLLHDIQRLQDELRASIKQLRTNGTNLAKAEHDYKIAIKEKAIKLRSEDMAVTMISLTIYGYKDIAELRLKRDIAKTVYEANQEHINATKLILRLLEAQLNREWSTDLAD